MFKKSRGVPDLIAYRPNRYRYDDKRQCVICDNGTFGALSFNGISMPSCGHMNCNKKIIEIRKAAK